MNLPELNISYDEAQLYSLDLNVNNVHIHCSYMSFLAMLPNDQGAVIAASLHNTGKTNEEQRAWCHRLTGINGFKLSEGYLGKTFYGAKQFNNHFASFKKQ